MNDGGPAYPTLEVGNSDERGITYFSSGVNGGMTLRDFFAASVLPALVGDRELMEGFVKLAKSAEEMRRAVAVTAYAYADALLAARSTAGGEQ